MHPPSMATTEADSSSTTGNFEEVSSILNKKCQSATEVPIEKRSVPPELVLHEAVRVEEKEELRVPQDVAEEKPRRPSSPGSNE
jgi:hypothetical protein